MLYLNTALIQTSAFTQSVVLCLFSSIDLTVTTLHRTPFYQNLKRNIMIGSYIDEVRCMNKVKKMLALANGLLKHTKDTF